MFLGPGQREGPMAWGLEGTSFDTGAGAVLCPCGGGGFTLPADNERCQVVFAIHVDSGEIEGTDVSGLSVIMVADAPGMMMDGNWRVGTIMDEQASPQQAQALGAVFSGQKGGPMADFAPLITEDLGVETA